MLRPVRQTRTKSSGGATPLLLETSRIVPEALTQPAPIVVNDLYQLINNVDHIAETEE